MKKVISLVLVFILMLFVAVTPAFAESIQFPTEGQEWLFFEEFDKCYTGTYAYDEHAKGNYREKCYHYDDNNNMDWALLSCPYVDSTSNDYAVFGDMIYLGCFGLPFHAVYGIYDLEQDKVLDLTDLDDLSEYDGLKDYLYSIGYIQPIGDFDHDKKLTILDATGIQCAEAGLKKYYSSDDLESQSYHNIKVDAGYFDDKGLRYLTDIDRDGKRTVMDATAIQYKLAGLEV